MTVEPVKLTADMTERPSTDWVLPQLFIRRGLEQPDTPFLFEVGGSDYTYGEALDRSLRLAAAMRKAGVTKGDRVISMVDNSADSVIIMSACALVSAVHVPINVAYVGHMLQHAFSLVKPKLAFVQDAFVERFAGIELSDSTTLVVRGNAAASAEHGSFSTMVASSPLDVDSIEPASWDETGTFLFTSGTTGASKAVLIPWLHFYYSSVRTWQGHELDATARFYSPWPINHISGAGATYLTILLGGSLVVRDRWSTNSFLDDVTQYSCTVTTLMAEMVGYVEKMEGTENTPLTHSLVAPITESTQQLFDRMGAKYCTHYSSTETNSPIGSVGYAAVPVGSCGSIRPGVDVRLVDEQGEDVPVGTTGELLVRSHDRGAMNQGYWGMPEATAEAWRDGWFHTGDLLRQDEDGFFYVAGRLKDRIRVRGENVNPDELEAIVKGHPAVASCSAVGAPIEGGEDQIYLFVVPAEQGFDEDSIRAYCEVHLPRFMRPAHILEVETIPATPTGKIQRAVLRDRIIAGSPSGTADRR